MNMVKYQRGRNIVPFSQSLSRTFDDFFTGSFVPMTAWGGRPQVDIVEEEGRVLLIADMPGLEKKDIKVTVHDGLLSIQGDRNEFKEDKENGYTRTERFMGTFSRSFNLPTWADGSKVTADYKNGVLTVVIPKTEQARPKEIDINVG